MDYSKVLTELHHMQQIYATLFTVTNKLQNMGDTYFETLTLRQYMTMLSIAHLPEDQTTLNNIAAKMETTKQSTQRVVANLESKGYVISKQSKLDKRSINVAITEIGVKVMMDCGEKAVTLMTDIFEDFSAQQLADLWILLKKLNGQTEEENSFEEDVNHKFENTNGFDEAQKRALNLLISRRARS